MSNIKPRPDTLAAFLESSGYNHTRATVHIYVDTRECEVEVPRTEGVNPSRLGSLFTSAQKPVPSDVGAAWIGLCFEGWGTDNMAQVTITLADDGTEDGVMFRVEFDPPLDDDTILSAAQNEAAFIIEVMQRRASGESLKQMSEEMDEDSYGTIELVSPVEVLEPEGNN